MKLKKNWFYNFCIALSVMGMAYILISGVSNVGAGQEYPYAMKGMLFLIFLLTWAGVHFLALLSARLGIAGKMAEKKRLSAGLEAFYVILILSAAFVLRYAVVLKLPMQPESDYKTYYEIAQMLNNGTLQEKGEGYCNYIAMFPHVIGYSYVLKNIFVLFGTSVFNGQFANILFSLGTVFLIYRIARKLGGRLAGMIALTAAAFWPSQILYINMLAAEYVFTFFLYLCILLFLHLVMDYDGTTKHGVRGILLHILLGFLIAVTAAVRPMALILLVAIILCLLPQKMKLPNIPRNSISIWVRFLEKGWLRGVLILVSYMFLSGIITTNIELAINKSVPSSGESFGYNLLVGLNSNSKGGWNEEDSRFLYDNLESTGSAIEAQIACRDLALKRLNTDPKAIFNLFMNKYELLWDNDDYGATWNQVFLQEQNQLTPERLNFLSQAQWANHIIYMVFILFSLMALIYMLQKKASYLYVLILVYLGTVAMHLLVESQNRYHFHVLPVIMIAASVGVSYIFESARQFVKASDIQRQEKEKLLSREEAVMKQFEEEEHLAIENRYKNMTNAFDMQSAISNGNVIVTVSEKYLEDCDGDVHEKIEKEENPLPKQSYESISEAAATLEGDGDREKAENGNEEEIDNPDMLAQEREEAEVEVAVAAVIESMPGKGLEETGKENVPGGMSGQKTGEAKEETVINPMEFPQTAPALRCSIKGKEIRSHQKSRTYKNRNLRGGSKPSKRKVRRVFPSLFGKKGSANTIIKVRSDKKSRKK